MKNHPDNKPEFACSRCLKVMCSDCLSMAAEYEFLHDSKNFELIRLQDQVKELKQELAHWKRRSEAFEHVAKLGYNDVIQNYLNTLVEQFFVNSVSPR